MCLTADTCLRAYSGIASLIRAQSDTFGEIDHEIFSMVILLTSAESRRVVVSHKQEHVHEVLANHLVKLARGENVVR